MYRDQKHIRTQYIPPPMESLSEAIERWRKNHQRNAREDKQRLTNNTTNIISENKMSDYNVAEDKTYFILKTDSGILSYAKDTNIDYTNFVRTAIEMMLLCNTKEIEPSFKDILLQTLSEYENGGSNFEEDEEIDFLEETKLDLEKESQKYEEAQKYTTSIPKTDNLYLRIFSLDFDDSKRVEKILSKHTDLPPNIMHEVLNNSKSFSLPYEKAIDLYIQLRTIDVILTLKPLESTLIKKKSSAAKKSIKSAPNKKYFHLTGNEKLSQDEGIIK